MHCDLGWHWHGCEQALWLALQSLSVWMFSMKVHPEAQKEAVQLLTLKTSWGGLLPRRVDCCQIHLVG